MSTDNATTPPQIPILLLKTRTTPNDGYEEFFRKLQNELQYTPVFVPVLEHNFNEDNLRIVRDLLEEKSFEKDRKYGGLIFTSHRAVEAFSRIIVEGFETHDAQWPNLQSIPIYTVGPATSRALHSIPPNKPLPLQIFGEQSGNGEALAHFMLDHYGEWYSSLSSNPALLFLVGEQRRDIIPKTLMDTSLPARRQIPVHELTVYKTGVMESFAKDFSQIFTATEEVQVRWVVVFSPTGCEAMLRQLGMLDENTGRVKSGERGGGCGVRKGRKKTYIATIGPTTRDYLRKTFGFEADVCAARPTPESLGEGISGFMQGLLVVTANGN